MNKLFSATLLLISLVASCTLIVQPIRANSTITVPDDYSSIQAAIDNASEGDEIFVKIGTYNENLTINKSISLIGENKFSTIVVGTGNTACLIHHDNVNVTGFTFKRPSTMRWHYGIHLLNIKYCNIFGNNIESTFYGIWLVDASYNNIFANTATGNWNGIHLSTSNFNNISNNSVTGSHDIGIDCSGSNDNLIMNNYAALNGWAGINLDGNSPNTNNWIAHNNITGNGAIGIAITSTDSCNNKIIANTITATGSNTSGEAILIAWDNNIVVSNIIVGNQAGIQLDGAQNNTIRKNIIENNNQGSILIHSYPFRMASQNNIYENNIMNPVHLTGNIFTHNWDNTTTGNYWINYNGTDTDENGIGDSAYIIDTSNNDHYPLMHQVNISTEIPNPPPLPTSTPIPTESPTIIPTPTPTPTSAPTSPNTPSPTSTLTPSPSIPEFPTWIGIPLILITASLMILIKSRPQITLKTQKICKTTIYLKLHENFLFIGKTPYN